MGPISHVWKVILDMTYNPSKQDLTMPACFPIITAGPNKIERFLKDCKYSTNIVLRHLISDKICRKEILFIKKRKIT